MKRNAALDRYLVPGTIAMFLAAQGSDATRSMGWLILTFGSCAALLRGALDWQRPLSTFEKGIAACVLAGAVSAALGVDPHRSVQMSVPLWASLLLWILIVRPFDMRLSAVSVAAGLAVAASVQLTALAIAALRDPQAVPADWVADAGALWLIVPNDIGWIACALPLLAAPAPRPAAVLTVLLVLFLAACLMMHSRTAAVVALVVSGAFWVLSWRRPAAITWRRWAGMAALAVCAGMAFTIASMRARLQLWQAAWGIFLDHPSTGIGIHNFVIVYRSYLPPNYELIDARITPWPHNLFLEIAAEWGLIGVIPVVFLAVILVRRSVRACDEPATATRRALMAGCIGMAMLAAVEASLLRQWVWLLGTVLCALMCADFAASEQGNDKNDKGILAEGAAPGRIRNVARR